MQFPKFQVPWQQQPVPRHHLAESQLIRIWQQVQQKTDSICKKTITHLSILITSYVCTIQKMIVPSHNTFSLAYRGWKKEFSSNVCFYFTAFSLILLFCSSHNSKYYHHNNNQYHDIIWQNHNWGIFDNNRYHDIIWQYHNWGIFDNNRYNRIMISYTKKNLQIYQYQ